MGVDASPFKDRNAAVFGLGRSGLAAARALHAAGAHVTAWDDDKDARASAESAGVSLADLYKTDWPQGCVLIVSPGVPLRFPAPHPVVARADSAGAEIIGDIELLARCLPGAAFIGVTGTNGKSTTTALIGHILKSAGRKAETGGNIGAPVMDLPALGAGGVYVLEMSSYQLDLTHTLVFDVAVFLNISNDHLDRHGGLEGYITAKRRIFGGQSGAHTAVIGVDDLHARAVFEDLKNTGAQNVIPVSGEGAAEGGVYAKDGVLYDNGELVMDLGELKTLRGRHNAQNAAAAWAACRAAGLGADDITAGMRSFKGLAHRQEHVTTVNGVLYVNDSKATNAEAAARALSSYSDIYWIAGGRAKDGGLGPVLDELANVHHAFLIGEAAEAFARELKGRVPAVTVSGDLKTAVAQARAQCAADSAKQQMAEPAVLLAPACASFDQFADFEARGDAFRALAAADGGETGLERAS